MSKVRVFDYDRDELLDFYKLERVLYANIGWWIIGEDGKPVWKTLGHLEPREHSPHIAEKAELGQDCYEGDGIYYTEADLTFLVCEHDTDEDDRCEECGNEAADL
jgi:hypothetical protein